MRVERVVTNETCNQRCGYCEARRSEESRPFALAARERIEQAIGTGGGREIVLAGGEPGLRRDLPELVRFAKERGAARVVLRTNAAVIDRELAERLAASGLDLARVKVPAWGDDYDRFTEDPGSFQAMERGVVALASAGIAVEAVVVLVAENLGHVEELPDRIAAAFPTMKTLVVEVVADRARGGRALDAEIVTPVIERLDARARRLGLRVRLDADRPIAPCLFPNPSRTAHLHALSPGGNVRAGYAHVAACAECVAREICPGLGAPDAARGQRARPIRDPRTRRRLTVIGSTEEQIEREVVTRETHRTLDEGTGRTHTIRVQFQCNQSCHFCFVSTHLPPPDRARVEAAIEEAGRVGAAVALSGGEPTLNPDLVHYVRLARRAKVPEIELQTNAIRLADPELARLLAEAGVDVAFVSLHGSCAEVSDRVTAAPGTFARTVLGIDTLVNTTIRVRLNYVFCGLNAGDFVPWVEMVAARWLGVTLTVSFVAPSTDLVPRTPDVIRRYEDARPEMARGLARAKELGLTATGFESMCAVPLCVLPAEVREYLSLPPIEPGSDGGEFLKVGECYGCRVRDRCWGIRRGYAELHGTSELRAIR